MKGDLLTKYRFPFCQWSLCGCLGFLLPVVVMRVIWGTCSVGRVDHKRVFWLCSAYEYYESHSCYKGG